MTSSLGCMGAKVVRSKEVARKQTWIRFCIRVASSDKEEGIKELKMLQKLYTMLGSFLSGVGAVCLVGGDDERGGEEPVSEDELGRGHVDLNDGDEVAPLLPQDVG